jgi:hypothetical protein
MYRNQSTSERVMRMGVGLVALSLAIVGPQSLWGLLGAIPLLTGMMGFDPFYRMLGVSTRRVAVAQVSRR